MLAWAARPLGALRSDPRTFLVFSVAAASAVAGIVLASNRAWLCDDAFITFRYIRNWSGGLGIVYNVGEHVEGYSHPLWLLILAPVAWLATPERASVVLGLVSLGVVLGILLVESWRASRIPVAAVLLALNFDFTVWATGGLETMAVTTMVVCAVLALWHERYLLSGILYSAAVLLRPDAALFYVVALPLVPAKTMIHFLAPGTVILLHVAWRYSYYGELLPNPYYAKVVARGYWRQGLFYLWTFFSAYWSAWIAIPALLLVRDRRIRLLLASTVVYLVLFVARVGGDFMFARFVIPTLPLIYLAGELALERLRFSSRAIAVSSLLVLLVVTDEGRRDALFRSRSTFDLAGITDEHWYYTRDVGGGRNEIENERMIGEALKDYFDGDSVRVLLRGQAALAYYGQFPSAVEGCGLTDHEIARLPMSGRGRPGHEKWPTLELMRRRRIDFVFMRSLYDPHSVQALFRVENGVVRAEAITVDTLLFTRLKERHPHDIEFIAP